jgi:23S rRNA pseudouridine1911/1915/1917 synthase
MEGEGSAAGYEEILELEVDPGQTPVRIDKFLVDKLPNVTRNRIQEGLKEGHVQVDGKAVKANHKVRPGERIRCVIPRKEAAPSLEPEDIPLEVLYEDEDLLVINKPAGMVVHPGHGNRSGTLVNALLHHLGKELPEGSAPERPGLVHRIDKDTSGAMVIAKKAEVLSELSDQFYRKSTGRRYHALVWGDLEEDEGRIEGYIGRSVRDRKIMELYQDPERGKHSVTHYRVLERFHYVTLVECRLETGRTHQVRVHFKAKRKPLFNDEAYGGSRILKGTRTKKYEQFVRNAFNILPRQALHAYSLAFEHPQKRELMQFEAPWPQEFRELIEKWRNYSKGSAEEEG